jgi:hypothetical protein
MAAEHLRPWRSGIRAQCAGHCLTDTVVTAQRVPVTDNENVTVHHVFLHKKSAPAGSMLAG